MVLRVKAKPFAAQPHHCRTSTQFRVICTAKLASPKPGRSRGVGFIFTRFVLSFVGFWQSNVVLLEKYDVHMLLFLTEIMCLTDRDRYGGTGHGAPTN